MREEGERTYKKSSVILGATLVITLFLLVVMSTLYFSIEIRLRNVEADHNQLRTLIETLEANVSQLTDKVDELEADIGQLANKIDELEAEIESLRGEELTAEVIVDANDSIGAIDRNIYGHFIEHLDNCVYNGVWVGENSSIPNLRGLRTDVLEAVRAIRPPIIRWPGGNFASDYHWEDGIGPPEKRPQRWDRPWKKTETNQFGTHEFIDFCREVNAEPYIVVNMVSGNSSEAAHWVEYCNSKEGEWTQKRAANGHPEPFNVTYWGLGNEMYGEWQYDWQREVAPMNASGYANKAVEFAMNMRQADPSIKLIAVGWYENDDWNRKVLEVASEDIDYLSVHKYYMRYDYYTVVAHALDTERRLKEVSRLIDEVIGENGKQVKIAFDEWNLGEPSKLFHDSLFAAGMFNMFHRMCNEVTMANLAQLVNMLHACVVTNEQGQSYVTPVYLAFKLYTENTGDIALNTLTKGDYYLSYGMRKVPFLDCSATIDKHGKTLYLAAINRHKTDAIKCKIELRNFDIPQRCMYQELNADNVTAKNDFLNPNNVKTTGGSICLDGNPFYYTFPPHSITILKLKRHFPMVAFYPFDVEGHDPCENWTQFIADTKLTKELYFEGVKMFNIERFNNAGILEKAIARFDELGLKVVPAFVVFDITKGIGLHVPFNMSWFPENQTKLESFCNYMRSVANKLTKFDNILYYAVHYPWDWKEKDIFAGKIVTPKYKWACQDIVDAIRDEDPFHNIYMISEGIERYDGGVTMPPLDLINVDGFGVQPYTEIEDDYGIGGPHNITWTIDLYRSKTDKPIVIDEWGLRTESYTNETYGTVNGEETKAELIGEFVDYIRHWDIVWCYFGLHDLKWSGNWGLVEDNNALRLSGKAMQQALSEDNITFSS